MLRPVAERRTRRRTNRTTRKNRWLREHALRFETLEERSLLSALPLGPMQGGTPNYFGPEPNWAYSPQPSVDPGTGAITGGIRKFVDSMAGMTEAGVNNLGQYIPVAVPDTTTYPGSDYYEIAVVEWTEKMHSDLNPTTLRGYVQLETPVLAALGVSKHVPLTYTDDTPDNPNDNPPILDSAGQQVFAVDAPHYMGPTIVAEKEWPVRMKFTNYLPTGADGDLFIPVDTTMMGAGAGPIMAMPMMAMPMMEGTQLVLNIEHDAMLPGEEFLAGMPVILEGFTPAGYNGEYRVLATGLDATHFQVALKEDLGAVTILGHVMEAYTDNRQVTHLHGGLTPWISDGTPHQWITPAGDFTNYDRGAIAWNVPDMPDPGEGSMTYFYPNQQSARLMFYHDHAMGITRLNVYAGAAAPYVLTDAVEQDLIARGILPAAQIPLVIQDKSFIDPTSILITDPTWPIQLDDALSNLWYPHVYMPNQDPNALDGVNPMGRWDYGPWIWPPFPVDHLPIHNVTEILVTNGGSGYSAADPPQVTITHPVVDEQGNPVNGVTREAAIAEAVVDSTGRVTAINVISGGSYEGVPIVTIAPPPDPAGTTATAFAVTFQTPNVPDNSMGMETFMDTPVVNGTVYPYLEVDPQAYRFRILNAANDRFWNLQLHEATSIISSITVTNRGSGYTRPPSVVITDAGGTGAGAVATSTIDPVTGAVTGVDLLVVGSGYTNPTVTFVGGGGTGATATANVYSDPTEVGMVPFTGFQPDGNLWPEGWPTPDWRDGGIPDPTKRGPDIIQIGTEGGFLPTPVVFDNTPIGWDRDPKSATMGNVLEHNLFMGCAERADIIVDFSQYAGKTLILYNDAPAAVPARDPRYDYYSVNRDETETGGSVPTLPGYGPNTRTIMQIRVKPADPLNPPQPYDFARLQDAFTTTADHLSAFVQGQEPIIVPQADYNSAYGLSGVGADTFPNLTMAYERIQDLSLTFRPLDLTTPAVADLAPNAVTIENQNKAIIEEWNTDWGRMEGFLGVEMKYTNSTNQTSLWFRMQDPVTEIMTNTGDVMTFLDAAPDGTEIWKVTHNGVDTHPIHFHLFNVQVINRVDWGGVVKPPEPNELGWKETLRMNPLEDCIVAMRPSVPKLEFGVPDSVRLLDPAMPQGSTMGFVPFDANGNPTTTVNDYYNFGWEYMWHCHILSHEEMDMMRPIQVNVARALADAPVLSGVVNGARIELNWTDGTPVGDPNTPGNPANEVGFRIERAEIVGGVPGTYLPIASLPANSTSFIDATFDPLLDYFYQVVAFNAAGETTSNAVQLTSLPANSRPTVSDFGVSVNEDTVLYFSTADFSAHFTDPDLGNTLQAVTIVSLPVQGTLSLGSVAVTAGQEIPAAQLGALNYLGHLNYYGPDSFTWDGSDGFLYSGTAATVSITVNPVNDPPTVVNPLADVVVDQGAPPMVIDLTNVFTDVDLGIGQALTLAVLSSNPALVTADVTGTQLTLTFLDFQSGDATVTVTATDPQLASGSDVFAVTVNPNWDLGDAPDSYGTTLASNGARHQLTGSTLFLGARIDKDADGQPTPDALGDDLNPLAGPDDEDGVVLPGTVIQGQNAAITVTANAPGQLSYWVDFNQNGVFENASEKFTANLVGGANNLTFAVPANAVPGTTFSRFRLSSSPVADPTGPAIDGEVEDYQLIVSGAGVVNGVLRIVGTQSADNVLVKGGGQTVQVNTSFLASPVAFDVAISQIEMLLLAGNDTASVQNNVSLPAIMYGGAGNDSLTAGAGYTMLFGEAGDDILTGGGANDVLVGGAGNDTLTGKGGRDLLIGGLGIDSLKGAPGEDIYIGGSTIYDLNRIALDAILAEWGSNKPRATRIANLSDVNALYFFQLGVTVLDDGEADTIFADPSTDWILPS